MHSAKSGATTFTRHYFEVLGLHLEADQTSLSTYGYACVFVYIVQVSKQLKKRTAAFTMLNIFLLRAVFYVQYISIVSLIRSFYFLVKHDFRFSSSLTNTNYFPHELKNHESNNRSRTYFHRFMLILLLLL